MAVESLQIIISERGSGKAVTGIRNVGKAASSSSSAVNLLKKSMLLLSASFFGSRLLGGMTEMVNTLTDFRNRMKLVSESSAETSAVMSKLFDISNRTRSSFEGTSTVFTRAALAAKQLGISNQEVLDVTESLNKAVILSGVNAREANAGLIQLSQGLASNRLSGDELRSVMEQLPYVADIIAKSMRDTNGVLGVTRGRFRELAHQGKVTTKVILDAFKLQREALEEQFSKTIPTIGQSVEVFKNKMLELTDVFDQNAGFSEIVSKSILGLADNIGLVIRAIGAGGLLLLLGMVNRMLLALVTSTKAWTFALMANPVGMTFHLIGKAIMLASVALTVFADKIFVLGDGATTLSDVFVAAFRIGREWIMRSWSAFQTWLNGIEDGEAKIRTFGALFIDTLRGMVSFLVTVADNFLGILTGISVAIAKSLGFIPSAFKEAFILGVNASISILETLENKVIEGLNKIRKFLGQDLLPKTEFKRLENTAAGAMQRLGNVAADGFMQGFNATKPFQQIADAVTASMEAAGGALSTAAQGVAQERIGREIVRRASQEWGATQLGRAGPAADETEKEEKLRRRRLMYEDIIRRLEQEGRQLKLNTREREIQLGVDQARERLWRELKPQEEEEIRRLLVRNQLLADQARLLDELRAPQIEQQRGMDALNALMDQGSITSEEYSWKLRQIEIAGLALDRSLEGGLKRGFLTLGDQITNVSTVASDLMMNSFNQAENALVEFVKTGQMSFQGLIDSMINDLARLAVRAAITAPLMEMMTGGGGSGGSGWAGALGNLFSAGSGAAGAAEQLPGFKTGGGFTVGGSGGPDSQLVAFRATPGEEVEINKPGQSGGKGVTVVFNISTPDADSFKRSQGQIMAQAQAALSRASMRNN